MKRSPRAGSAWRLCAAAALFGLGCFTYKSEDVAPPMEISPPPAALLEPPELADEPEVAPELRAALAAYSQEIRRFIRLADTSGRASLVEPLRALADTIAAVPGGPDELLLAQAAEEIRWRALQIAMSRPFAWEGEPAQAALAALDEAAVTLSQQAEGPYAGVPEVVEGARRLEAATERLRASSRIQLSRNDLIAALRQVERVVRAIYTALARGDID
jgi:hypothetical protein